MNITFASVIRDLSTSCTQAGASVPSTLDLDARRTNTALYQIVSAHLNAHQPRCCDRDEFTGRCFKDDALLL